MSYPETERTAPEQGEKETGTAPPDIAAANPSRPIELTAQKPAEKMKEITDRLEQGIQDLFESDRFKEYLQVMSKFHNYSFNNTLLIAMQKPDATLIAGYNSWKNLFGRQVSRGAKGIKVIAPSPYKIKKEVDKIDPKTQKPVTDKNGKPVKEETEITVPAFKVVSVFDVSQTSGKPLPQLAADLSGNVQQYEVFMEALRRASPVPIEIKPVARDTDGFFSIKAQSITIRAGMSEVQTVCAAVHEIAHAKLHDYEHMTELADDGETILVPGEKSRNTEEVEAESISYAVCQYYGIETGENSFGYGRITLFRNRLIAGSIAASAGAVLLAAGNHALSILISGRLPKPDGWNHAWFRSTAIVLIGTIGFFLFAAFVCDSLKNQPAAMCICGVPFAFSYFINVAVLKKFEFFWFVRYGFFAEWMRGRRIGVTPGVWGVWYALLLGGLLLAAIHQRKERKEL